MTAPNDGGGIVVPVLELPTINLQNLSLAELQKMGPVLKGKAQEVRSWVTNLLPTLEEFDALDREVKELYGSQIEEARKTLNRLLHEETTKAYRRAAWLAYLLYMLNKEVTKEDAASLVDKLVADGFLQQAKDGPITVDYARYKIPAEAFFEDDEITVIQKAAKSMLAKAEALAERRQKERIRKLREQGEIPVLDLPNGVPGFYVVNIPPEQIENTVYWRPGGILLVECSGEQGEKRIYPLDAVGAKGFESAITEAVNLGVYVPVNSLAEKKPPWIQGFSPDQGKKVALLWFILQRGINAARKDVEISLKKEELKQKTMENPLAVSEEEFMLHLKPGVSFVEFDGVREITNGRGKKRIYQIFFAAQRTAAEGENPSLFQILEAPEHLQDFLGVFVGKPYGEGKSFEGLPPRLAELMKAIHNQVNRRNRIASASQGIKEATES